MFLKRLPGKHEGGLTIMSLAVALAVMAMVTGGIATAVVQVQQSNASTTGHLVAAREVQNAGSWIVRDARGASSIQLSGDADGFPLIIRWTGTDGHAYETEYVISVDNEMFRYHYKDRHINPDPDNTTLVAQHISPDNTTCAFGSNDELVLTLTSVVGSGTATRIETREYRVFPVPSLF